MMGLMGYENDIYISTGPLYHQLCVLCMEEAWYAEEKVSALEEVDVFIFSSVFV